MGYKNHKSEKEKLISKSQTSDLQRKLTVKHKNRQTTN